MLVRPMCFSLLFWLIALTLPVHLDAHFVWIARDSESGKIQVYFGESPEPGEKQFLHGILNIKTRQWTGKKYAKATYYESTKGDLAWFVSDANHYCSELIGHIPYGVFSRGDKSMFLDYSAKYSELDKGNASAEQSARELPLDILAVRAGKQIELQVRHHQNPVSDCELVIQIPGATKTIDHKTDAKGRCFLKSAAGRYLIRAKMVDKRGGQKNGKPYTETRFYCTLVLDVPGKNSGSAATQSISPTRKPATHPRKIESKLSAQLKTGLADQELPDLPIGITSFGGARIKNRLYVYGGHTGKAHSYYESGQNNVLYSLDLDNPVAWKKEGTSVGLQGLAMVSYRERLFRLGGFHAHNKEGEDQDLRSVAEFAEFDPALKKWKQLAPMPVARSSFDAVVVGSRLYVVGGWTMNGNSKKWCKSALVFDFSERNPKWKNLPAPPFQRRAISLGYQGKKLVVIGGMQQVGGPTRKVALFDLETQQWSEGPELDGNSPMEGFGSSCFNVGGRLVVSTYGGNVYALSDDFSNWNRIHKLELGRFFHRLLEVNPKEFVLVGGANMETGKFLELEILPIKPVEKK